MRRRPPQFRLQDDANHTVRAACGCGPERAQNAALRSDQPKGLRKCNVGCLNARPNGGSAPHDGQKRFSMNATDRPSAGAHSDRKALARRAILSGPVLPALLRLPFRPSPSSSPRPWWASRQAMTMHINGIMEAIPHWGPPRRGSLAVSKTPQLGDMLLPVHRLGSTVLHKTTLPSSAPINGALPPMSAGEMGLGSKPNERQVSGDAHRMSNG
jgi:hypothetical protein